MAQGPAIRKKLPESVCFKPGILGIGMVQSYALSPKPHQLL